MQSLKSRTAKKCNELLDLTGKPFWQEESYDHVVRNDEEFIRVTNYVVQNPVKAGLTNKWQDWKYTYLSPEVSSWYS